MMPRMATEPTRRTVRNGEIELAVFEAGDPAAPTVLLVHGWPDTHQLWHAVTDRLVGEFHVVSYDTRGMGETTDPGTVEGFAPARARLTTSSRSPTRSARTPRCTCSATTGARCRRGRRCATPGPRSGLASFTSISGPNLDHMGHWVRRDARLALAAGHRSTCSGRRASSSYVAFFVSPPAPPVFRTASPPRSAGTSSCAGPRGSSRTRRTTPRRSSRTWSAGCATTAPTSCRGLGGPRERRTAVPVLQLVRDQGPGDPAGELRRERPLGRAASSAGRSPTATGSR